MSEQQHLTTALEAVNKALEQIEEAWAHCSDTRLPDAIVLLSETRNDLYERLGLPPVEED